MATRRVIIVIIVSVLVVSFCFGSFQIVDVAKDKSNKKKESKNQNKTRGSSLTFVLELVGGLGRLVLDVLHHIVDLGFVLEEEGPDDAGVDQDGAVGGGGGHAPHQEGTLRGGVSVLQDN